jgi:hypothetical protein
MATSKRDDKRRKPRLLKLRIKLALLGTKTRKAMNRANAAHIFMISFVLFNSVGAWLIAPQYGLITAGVCSGIYGYLLGNE